MAFAVSRRVSCGITVCLPAGAPGAPLGAAARAGPRRGALVLRAGTFRRAGFFEVFFFLAMVFLPRKWPPETTAGAARQRLSTICRLQIKARSQPRETAALRPISDPRLPGTRREREGPGNRIRR